VELALGAPFLIVLTLGVADFGRAFYYRELVTNTTRQALRLAVQDQSTQKTIGCASGSGAQVITRNMPDAGVDRLSILVNAAALESSTDGTAAGAVLKNTAATTTVTFTFHCSGATAAYTNATATSTDPTSAASDAVQVQMDYSFKLITPFLNTVIPGQTVHIKTRQYQRNEF
jgi:Flp pilus assembly protein TadG